MSPKSPVFILFYFLAFFNPDQLHIAIILNQWLEFRLNSVSPINGSVWETCLERYLIFAVLFSAACGAQITHVTLTLTLFICASVSSMTSSDYAVLH